MIAQHESLEVAPTSETDDLNRAVSIHSRLIKLLEDTISSLSSYNTEGLDSDLMEQQIDKQIADEYFGYMTAGKETDKQYHYLNLIHLLSLKEKAVQSSDFKQDIKFVQDKLVHYQEQKELQVALLDQVRSILDDQKSKREAPVKPTRADNASKTDEQKTESVFNTSSIVGQIIASARESGQNYTVKVGVDNKGFEDRKAFMPMPLQNGTISRRFNSSHRQLEITSDNPECLAVSQGKVIYTKRLGGPDYTIVIMHDEGYFTVYRNISKSRVDLGQDISYGQTIGLSAKGNDGQYQLIFEIRNDGRHIDPLHWIKKG